MGEINPCVYVVDDDASIRAAVASLLRSAGVAADTFASPQELLVRCRTAPPSCLVLDVKLPGLSGLDVQQELARMNVHVPIVFLTGYADVPTSVRAMKSGALEFLTKPFDGEALLAAVQQGLARRHPARSSNKEADAPELVGCSPRFEAVLKCVAAVSMTDATVLIVGETGTGKELVARSIHLRSHRASRPLVSGIVARSSRRSSRRSCSATRRIVHGSAAAAARSLRARRRRNHLLDEVGELPPEAQVAPLRVLQERELERVGGNKPIRVDVRVIAATNRDLSAAITAGKFRSDLFFRLNVFPIRIPPLRERREDIPLLVEHFLRLRAATGTPLPSPDESTMAALERHDWPGNVRELQNVIERWAILGGTEEVPLEATWLTSEPTLPGNRMPDPPHEEKLNLREHVEALERELISRTITAVAGNQSEAARRLGVSRGALLGRLRKYAHRPMTSDRAALDPF
jgi:two-component system NtrC family response regulator